MIDIQLIESFIKAKMEAQHQGKDNAIKREDLLIYIHEFLDPTVSFRVMSKAYENLPICGGDKGLYIPATEDERDHQINRYTAWILAMTSKITKLKALNIPPQPKQRELWEDSVRAIQEEITKEPMPMCRCALVGPDGPPI